MRVLVVILGGLDHQFLSEWKCPNLRMDQWGPVVVDEIWNLRDVATPITAQLITGKTWRESGIADRKKKIVVYKSRFAQWLEEGPLMKIAFKREGRHRLYEFLRWARIDSHNFTRHDLKCSTLFDQVQESKAVYVPAYNPEPSWALGRNILDPRRFPAFGFDGALDLRDKNFAWRKKRFFEVLDQEPTQLLMTQFQYIDSTQHLYLSYSDEPQMDKVEEAYWYMDEFVGEIRRRAKHKYDRILLISDNGAAQKVCYRPTHHNRPYYAIDFCESLSKTNLRDFHHHILRWVKSDPNPGFVDG